MSSVQVKDKLTLTERMLLVVLTPIFNRALGYDNPIHTIMIRKYGLRAFFRASQRTNSLFKALIERYGEANAQYVIAFTGFWVGCRWCFIGHLMSGNLALFRDEGILGPLDERDLLKYELMTDERVLAELREVFADSRWHRLLSLIERLQQLRAETVDGTTEDDELLTEVMDTWDWVTECTIEMMDTDPLNVPAISGIGKDRKLLQSYHDARERARDDDARS